MDHAARVGIADGVAHRDEGVQQCRQVEGGVRAMPGASGGSPGRLCQRPAPDEAHGVDRAAVRRRGRPVRRPARFPGVRAGR